MHLLYETDLLRLEHEYESTFLVEKKSGKVLCEDEFYGDPTCGLISPDNDWAIMAGEHLCIWKKQGDEITSIGTEIIQEIHGLKLVDKDQVEILTDPWSEKSAIWRLDIRNNALVWLRDFPDYREQPHTEHIVW